jgi:hypothetical protein
VPGTAPPSPGPSSRTNSDEDGENRVVYLGYGRREDLAALLDGANDKRLILVTLAVVLAAYEAALDRQSGRQQGQLRQEIPAAPRLARPSAV